MSRLRLPIAFVAALFRRDATARPCACAPASSSDPTRCRSVAAAFVCAGPRRAEAALTSSYTAGPRPA